MDNRLEFTFHQCLGRGGFGEVYLATVVRPGGLSREMAVKVLRAGLDNEAEAVRRLRDEGRMMMLLNHPSILRAQQMCKLQGRIALLTEYIEGADFSVLIKTGMQGPPRPVIAAIGEVADALHCAWSTLSPETGRPLQLIHRDLKPENIRLTQHGQVKLLDFGIARSTEISRHAKTQAGDMPLTPGYAAPECFSRGEQGPASDIYALGATLYRLLTGEKLFEGMDLVKQFETAVLPKKYRPWLEERFTKLPPHPGIRHLVGAMLAQETVQRPNATQVHELCADLVEKLEGPSLVRWTRELEFPPPRTMKNAPLTGLTMREDAATPGFAPMRFSPPSMPSMPSPDLAEVPARSDARPDPVRAESMPSKAVQDPGSTLRQAKSDPTRAPPPFVPDGAVRTVMPSMPATPAARPGSSGSLARVNTPSLPPTVPPKAATPAPVQRVAATEAAPRRSGHLPAKTGSDGPSTVIRSASQAPAPFLGLSPADERTGEELPVAESSKALWVAFVAALAVLIVGILAVAIALGFYFMN